MQLAIATLGKGKDHLLNIRRDIHIWSKVKRLRTWCVGIQLSI